MKRLVLTVVGLLALFSVIRVQSQEQQSRVTIHPSLIEFGTEESGLSVGLGLIEARGETEKSWALFPLRIVLRSGKERFYLALNGLSFATRSGVNMGKPMIVDGVRHGDVVSVGGPVELAQGAKVEGSIWTFGADVTLRGNALVTGDVVAMGGRITAERGSRINGNKQALPGIQIPFLGFLSSPQSAETLQFVLELFGVALYLVLLFLTLHFRWNLLNTQTEMITSRWQACLLYLFVGAIVLPIVVAFLTASVIGIMVVPVLFVLIIVVTYVGFLGVTVRLGQVMVRGGGGGDGPARVYTAGLLGLMVIRGPSLLGRLLSLSTAPAIIGVGGFLKTIGAVALFLAMLYAFGAGLVVLREHSR